MLMLHTVAAQDGFTVIALQNRLSALDDQVQAQQQVVDAASAPGALQTRAAALGMVPTTLSHLHARSGGRAVGKLVPNYVPPVVSVAPSATTAHQATGSTTGGSASTIQAKKSGTQKSGTQNSATQTHANATKTAAAGGRGHAHRSVTTKQGSAGRVPAAGHQSHHRRSAAHRTPTNNH
jgi:hypothetical protein